jgi:tRNA pseudouridine13 synthase
MLARWLTTHVTADQLAMLRLRLGPVPAPRALADDLLREWDQLTLPLPSARLQFDPTAPWAEVVEAVMREERFPLREMKIRGMHKPFFSKGERPAALRPINLDQRAEADEHHRGFQKLVLRFDLPRGAYATMIVKRITEVAED